MNIRLLLCCVTVNLAQSTFAQKSALPNYDNSLLLETKIDTTANVSLGDLDGDGHLDLLLVKGRHWPIVDRVLLGDGKGGIRKSYDLGTIADRSYTGGLADFNGDGFLDIAVSNDRDRKLIYLNDGKGNFAVGSEFGRPEWPTRNLSIADINTDGLPDLILANRGKATSPNYICINGGGGKFNADCMPFAPYPSTTITTADVNRDGMVDLVVPHRNGGQGFVYLGGPDRSYPDTRRIPFGPLDATIRTAAAADFNGDKIPDIVTIDETKGVQLYVGKEDLKFSAGTSLADATVVPYALALADVNHDGKTDILVGHVEAPSTVFISGTNGFTPITFGDSIGTVYGFATGDFNEDGILDIAAARSEAISVLYFGKIKR